MKSQKVIEYEKVLENTHLCSLNTTSLKNLTITIQQASNTPLSDAKTFVTTGLEIKVGWHNRISVLDNEKLFCFLSISFTNSLMIAFDKG